MCTDPSNPPDGETQRAMFSRQLALINTVNGKIPYDWLNLTIDSFEIKCKTAFLMN